MVGFPVPQVVEQIIEVPKISSQDCILQRTVERVLDVPVPQIIEEVVEVPKIVSQDRIQQRTSGCGKARSGVQIVLFRTWCKIAPWSKSWRR